MRRLLFALLVLGLGPLRAFSEIVIFSDNFESGLNQWTSMQGFVTSGLVVNDPLGLRGKVLSFSGLSYQGDIFQPKRLTLVIMVLLKLNLIIWASLLLVRPPITTEVL
jgi:hypothetical protein